MGNMKNPNIRLLIVDDDDALRGLLHKRFKGRENFTVTASKSGEEALQEINLSEFDVGILDIRMPGISGVELLKKIKSIQNDFEAIMLTGEADVGSAVETMKLGAYDYIAKPCKLDHLERTINRAYEKKKLCGQNIRLKEELHINGSSKRIAGSSVAAKKLREQVAMMAELDEPVLITGENGSGIETVAQVIHQKSERKPNPFVTIHCGVLSDERLEIALFGHAANAFVDAGPRKWGLLESIDGGTVFLDEIEQLSPAMQVKVLQYLDSGEFSRFRGTCNISADTRVLLGASDNLEQLTRNKKFRESLFLKISALVIRVPTLRERKEDIPEVAECIFQQNKSSVTHGKKLSKKTVSILMRYDWPSNVRELASVLERAASLSTGKTIQAKDLPLSFDKKPKNSEERHLMNLSDIEKEHILHILETVNGNISKAARILGISRPKLYRKIEGYKSNSPK